jgi:isopentenyl-diphosphate Delta-isomerase
MHEKEQLLVLVNEKDEVLGQMPKMQAHVQGELHRAISIFLFNDKNEMLLQQRAFTKYHSGGLWTNACCSHPLLHETVLQAANRRLQEELGISTELTYKFNFIYKADMGNGLTEHELDHVFVGNWNDAIVPFNTDEVNDICFMTVETIKQKIINEPQLFTAWFKIIFENSISKII